MVPSLFKKEDPPDCAGAGDPNENPDVVGGGVVTGDDPKLNDSASDDDAELKENPSRSTKCRSDWCYTTALEQPKSVDCIRVPSHHC